MLATRCGALVFFSIMTLAMALSGSAQGQEKRLAQPITPPRAHESPQN